MVDNQPIRKGKALKLDAKPPPPAPPPPDAEAAPVTAPALAPAPAPVSKPAHAYAPEPSAPGPFEPLAGFTQDRAFLRSPGNTFVFFPGFRMDVDGAVFLQQQPKSGVFVRRARVELAGWMGPFYFNMGGDFAALPPPGADPVLPSALATTDDYLAFAPAGDLFILQAGQFSAPFMMENRTQDMYLDFIERSLTVRALGVPTHKEVGLMVYGADARRTFHYALGIFNGDGPNFRNVDNQVDFIGRLVLAPFARSGIEGLRQVSVGVSAWYGQHLSGLPFPAQSTAGGFRFLDPAWSAGQSAVPMELHQDGAMLALAGEVNLPLGNVIGLRGEAVFKKQDLIEADISLAGQGMLRRTGLAHLQGIGAYGELYLWLMGDQRLLPRPGLELPLRLSAIAAVDQEPPQGVMVALRGEVIKEDMTGNVSVNGNPNLATTRVVSGAAVINYWYGRRVRLSASYTVNLFDGTSESVKAIISNQGRLEHELLFRFGAGL